MTGTIQGTVKPARLKKLQVEDVHPTRSHAIFATTGRLPVANPHALSLRPFFNKSSNPNSN